MTDFKTAMLAMAKARPDEPVSLIVDLALAVSVEPRLPMPRLDNAEALGAWAAQQPAIATALAEGKKIQAIKELRTLTGSSLKQAKDAVDVLAPPAPSTHSYDF